MSGVEKARRRSQVHHHLALLSKVKYIFENVVRCETISLSATKSTRQFDLVDNRTSMFRSKIFGRKKGKFFFQKVVMPTPGSTIFPLKLVCLVIFIDFWKKIEACEIRIHQQQQKKNKLVVYLRVC